MAAADTNLALPKAPERRPIALPSLEKVKVHPPSLVELCLRKIAANFTRFDPALLSRELSKAKQLDEVYAILNCDIGLVLAAQHIDDEYYWKRRTLYRDRGEYSGHINDHGLSWKQFYLETELQIILEKFPLDFQQQELDELKAIIMAVRPWIFRLKISQYPSHYDISAILDPLPNLCSLQITYGRKRLGMEYERGLFGIKIVDVQYLVRYVRCCQTLIKLSLPCNMIDDELIKILMQGLETCIMLTTLDLSHNNIGDRGARRIAKLLKKQYVVETLDLSDNAIHANGTMHIGAHLAENMTLETLSLRLNRCEDNGVCHLLQDLCINKCLRSLNISSNDLTHRSLAYLSSMISENSHLEDIDLSANPLYDDSGEDVIEDADSLDPDSGFGVLLQCVQKNQTLSKLDCRHCNLPEALEKKFHKITKHRELRMRGISVEAYERAEIKKPEAEEKKEEEVKEEEEQEEEEKPAAEEKSGEEEAEEG